MTKGKDKKISEYTQFVPILIFVTNIVQFFITDIFFLEGIDF